MEPEQSRTQWACGGCLAIYRTKQYPARGKARDRTRIGICPRCALKARTRLVASGEPDAPKLAETLEPIGHRLLTRRGG